MKCFWSPAPAMEFWTQVVGKQSSEKIHCNSLKIYGIKAGVKLPVERSETNQFRFGNGQVETFSRLVDLPVGLAGKSGILQAAVVRGAAPLLVSRPALKRLGATINFAEDRLKLFHDRLELPLRVNAAGQYMVDVMQFDGLVGSCESNAATSVPPVPESCNLPTPKVQRDEPHVNLKTSPPISHKPKTDNLPVETTLVTESFPIVTDNISQSTKNGGNFQETVTQLEEPSQTCQQAVRPKICSSRSVQSSACRASGGEDGSSRPFSRHQAGPGI